MSDFEIRNTNQSTPVDSGLSLGGERLFYDAPIAFVDSIGRSIDALNKAVADINAASERMKAFGLSPQISVNGHDYGDKVSVYVQGDISR